MNILDKIIKDKQVEVNKKLAHYTKAQIRKNNRDLRIPLDFKKALQKKGLAIIAEVKKASPSKGLIRPDFKPLEFAVSYEKNGADCISVLTEEKYFQGHPDFLEDIKKHLTIPILRKDFIVDSRQISESYHLGADAILLIVSALTKKQLTEFKKLAEDFGLICLVEVHTLKELEMALELNSDLIGINNRSLVTFKTDIHHSIALRKEIPDSVVCVSESGIHTAEHCEILSKAGFDAILVGEILMRHADPGLAIHSLLEKVR